MDDKITLTITKKETYRNFMGFVVYLQEAPLASILEYLWPQLQQKENLLK